ncbi:hypothetical protein F1880_009071 [Penicillium rolfsii]|nr:hypothetical protein F1880_009071 [Penicillium rolfsii]
MPPRKAKRKYEEDYATDSEPVPDTPSKKAKKAKLPPAGRSNLTLSSTSMRRAKGRTHRSGPPPNLHRGPNQAMKEANGKDEQRKKRKGKANAKDEDDLEERKEEEEENEAQDVHLPIVRHQAEAGQRDRAPSSPPPTRKDPVINTPFQIELSQSTYLKFQSDRSKVYPRSDKITHSSMLREASLRYLLFSRDKDDGSYRDTANLTALINAYKHGWLEWSDEGKVTYWYKGKQLTQPQKYDPEEHQRLAEEQEEPRGLWVEGLSLPFYVRLCL